MATNEHSEPNKKIKVLHYVTHPKFYRCYLTFKDDDKHEHYFCINGSHAKLLKVPANRIISQGKSLHLTCGPCLSKINTINPDVIVFCNWNINIKVHKELAKYRKHVFNHGVMCPGLINFNHVQLAMKKFNRYYINPLEKNYLIKNKVSPERIEVVHGYIGIDYLATINMEKSRDYCYKKYKIPKDYKTLLFVTNKAGFGKKSMTDHNLTHKDYSLVTKHLNQFANKNDYYFFSKMKPTGTLELSVNRNRAKIRGNHKKMVYNKKKKKFVPQEPEEKKVETSNKIADRNHIISSGDLVYPFLSSDIIAIQGYSTSYLEALYLNKPVIIINVAHGEKSADYQGINQPKYEILPQVYNIIDLEEKLDQMQQDNFAYLQDPKYQEARIAYLEEHLGNPVEMITKKLYDLSYVKNEKPGEEIIRIDDPSEKIKAKKKADKLAKRQIQKPNTKPKIKVVSI